MPGVETKLRGGSSSLWPDTESQRQIDPGYFINEHRRAALADIDNANFSWFHVKVCLVASVAFFTDTYDVFVVNIASLTLGYVYGKGQKLNLLQDLGIKAAPPIGSLFGQLLFGRFADIVGRRKLYRITPMVMILATFAQAISGGGPAVGIIGVLVVWRFIMGIGIGGDIPLSAIITSEFASTRIRGRMMTVVFSAQGWGNFTAALVSLIVTVIYKDAILHDSVADLNHVDYIWRIVIGLGCVPAALAMYFRFTMPETPRYTMETRRRILQKKYKVEEIQRTNRWVDFRHYFGQWKNMKVLIGTAYSWFALSIAFYGLGLNSSIVLQAVVPITRGPQGVYDNLKNVCLGDLILSAAGSIPGYYFTLIFIDSWGRKRIQLMGFLMLTAIFIIMGFSYDKLTATPTARRGFVTLYCIANFFQNFGPSTTTFMIPGEVFPTRYRSTAHGISAASGKLGTIIAQVGFAQLKDIGGTNKFIKHILQIFAVFMLTGVFSTLLLPETRNKTLEELANEDQESFVSEN